MFTLVYTKASFEHKLFCSEISKPIRFHAWNHVTVVSPCDSMYKKPYPCFPYDSITQADTISFNFYIDSLKLSTEVTDNLDANVLNFLCWIFLCWVFFLIFPYHFLLFFWEVSTRFDKFCEQSSRQKHQRYIQISSSCGRNLHFWLCILMCGKGIRIIRETKVSHWKPKNTWQVSTFLFNNMGTNSLKIPWKQRIKTAP